MSISFFARVLSAQVIDWKLLFHKSLKVFSFSLAVFFFAFCCCWIIYGSLRLKAANPSLRLAAKTWPWTESVDAHAMARCRSWLLSTWVCRMMDRAVLHLLRDSRSLTAFNSLIVSMKLKDQMPLLIWGCRCLIIILWVANYLGCTHIHNTIAQVLSDRAHYHTISAMYCAIHYQQMPFNAIAIGCLCVLFFSLMYKALRLVSSSSRMLVALSRKSLLRINT